MEDVAGVYSILNTVNNKRYIGQSIHIYQRWREHKTALNAGHHQNDHLQYSWRKYGSDAFVFSILKICNPEELDSYEREYIKQFNSNNDKYGYNLDSGGNSGKRFSSEGYKHLLDACARPVICITTGEIFETMKSACQKYNVFDANMSRVINGERTFCGFDENKNLLEWADYIPGLEYGPLTPKTDPSYQHAYNVIFKRRVYCVTTGKMFDSVEEASKYYNTNSTSVRDCARGGRSYGGQLEDGTKLQWCYEEDIDTYKPVEIKIRGEAKQVVCLTTGEIFRTAADVPAEYKAIPRNIRSTCDGKRNACGIHPETGEKLRWAWYSNNDYEVEKCE